MYPIWRPLLSIFFNVIACIIAYIHPVYGVGIWTHDLLTTALLPLDHGFPPNFGSIFLWMFIVLSNWLFSIFGIWLRYQIFLNIWNFFLFEFTDINNRNAIFPSFLNTSCVYLFNCTYKVLKVSPFLCFQRRLSSSGHGPDSLNYSCLISGMVDVKSFILTCKVMAEFGFIV